MASKPQVTLTFAGDSEKLEKAFDQVAASSKTMASKVEESASSFDRVGEAADEVDTKAMGFRDTMTGVQDTMTGVSDIAKGDLFTGFYTLGAGIGDLGSGMFNFLVPGLKSAATWLKSTAIAQWAMNSALLASPITWIVVGIMLLIGVIILIATKTDWFQKGWKAAWGWIKDSASKVWDWLKELPDKIGGAFKRIGGLISAPFKAEFNLISWLWNNTVGKLSFRLPDWVPGIGGKGFSMPKLPKLATGGTLTSAGLALVGERGPEVVSLPQGASVIPLPRSAPAAAPSGGTLTLTGEGGDLMVTLILRLLRTGALRLLDSTGRPVRVA